MAISRYSRVPLLDMGKQFGTARASMLIRKAVESGEIDTVSYLVKDGERLDVIAGKVYGHGSLWWVIAGASAIGWWLQVPPGTQLVVPSNLSQIEGMFA